MARRQTRGRRPKAAALPKVTRPALSGIYPRTRLFHLLDAARKRPIVWLAAPGGAGKTTAIASYLEARKLQSLWYRMDAGDNDIASFFYYIGAAVKPMTRKGDSLPLLTPEYRIGLETFTANYFRDLFELLERPAVLVFDNYQDVAADGKIHEVLRQGFEQIPEGINAIVVGREEPPPAFTRLRASGKMAFLGWEEIRLREEESAEIVRLRRRAARVERDELNRLHRQTQGWVAGLVLLTERADADPKHSTERIAGETIFDFFANEIFVGSAPVMQQFLLKTAFLPKITVTAARQLTGEERSHAVLRDLARRNYFTVEHSDGAYEYHPLFRAFLANRAHKVYPVEEVNQLKQQSASLLATAGDIESAVALLQQAEDWSQAMALIFKHVTALIAQGRTETVEGWLLAFPESVRTENPWALYWLGVCRLPFAPAQARKYFKQAFSLFESQEHASPLYLAWSGIIESFVLEWKDFAPMVPWLDRYHSLATNRVPPSNDIETASLFTYLSGLFYGRSDHPDLATYVERAEHLLRREIDQNRRITKAAPLVLYYIWRGELSKLGSLLASLAPDTRGRDVSPLARLNWYSWKTLHEGATGAFDQSIRTMEEGLALAEATGIRVFDIRLLGSGIWGHVSVGRMTQARELLQRMEKLVGSTQASAFYRRYAAIVLLQEDEVARAIDEGRASLEIARSNGSLTGMANSLIGLGFALAHAGTIDEAMEAALEAQRIGAKLESKPIMAMSTFAEANVWRLRGNSSDLLRTLKAGFALSHEMGVASPIHCHRRDASILYGIALDAGVQSEHVRSMILKMQLPPPPGHASERWPWPLRIYTFGRFAIMKDDIPFVFEGRAQRKPLELLQAIVTFGAVDVSIAKLMRTLWPDTTGDAAKWAIETTLHRLRRLLGESCLVRQENRLTLDPNRCWIDTNVFEHAAELKEHFCESALGHAQRLIEIYRGAFCGEEEAPWMIERREKLHAAFKKATVHIGRHLETNKKWDAAVSLYQKAIEIDPLAEELYEILMRCYVELHRPAEALAVYQRCVRTFQSMKQRQPSSALTALYSRISSEQT